MEGKFALSLTGQDEAKISVSKFFDDLSGSLVGLAGAFILGGWLLKGLLGKTAGVTLLGKTLTLPTLTIAALLAWDIKNSFDKILPADADKWPSIAKLASQALGGILGAAAGGLVGHPILGAALGAYAFGWAFEGLLKIKWDIVQEAVDEIAGTAYDVGTAISEATGGFLDPRVSDTEAIKKAGEDWDILYDIMENSPGVVGADERIEWVDNVNQQFIDLTDTISTFNQKWLGLGSPFGLPGLVGDIERGILPKYQTGGPILGTGTGDKIPAMLEPGEFVIPNWMMRIPWLSRLIGRIWSGGKKFQAGGPVALTPGVGAGLAGLGSEAFDAMIRSYFEPVKEVVGEVGTAFEAMLNYLLKYMGQDEESRKFVRDFAVALGNLVKPITQTEIEFAKLQKEMGEIINQMEEDMLPITDAKTSWWAPISQAADMIVSGAGRLVDSIRTAYEAFQAENWAGVASGFIGIIQSIANIFQRWLREEKERLEERKRQLEEEKRQLEEILNFWKESLTNAINAFGSILSAGLSDILGPLAGVIDTLSNAFSKAVEMTFLEGIDLLRAGLDLFNSVITGLANSFMNLLKQADAYSAFQEEMSGLWKAIADLLGMFIWPLVAAIKALKGFLGIVDETSEKLASLNVPAGFRAARLEYAAAEAGVPAAVGGTGYTIPKWAVAVGEALASAIMDVLEGFGISDWTSLLQSFKEGSIKFWNYVITKVPEIINSIASILKIFENAFGGISVSTIVDWLKAGVNWLIHEAPALFSHVVSFMSGLWTLVGNVWTWIRSINWDQLMTDISIAFALFAIELNNLPSWTQVKSEIDALITAIENVERAIRGIESVGGAITNIAGGAAVGAAIGSFIPGIGTLLGGAIGGGLGFLASLLGFAEGGIVPGPIGAPQLAVVHGGEEILAVGHPAQGLGGATLTLNNIMQLDGREIARSTRKIELKEAILRGEI